MQSGDVELVAELRRYAHIGSRYALESAANVAAQKVKLAASRIEALSSEITRLRSQETELTDAMVVAADEALQSLTDVVFTKAEIREVLTAALAVRKP